MFWDIIIIAGSFWIIMSIFSFMESVQLKNIIRILEPFGQVYYGRDAGFLRTKYIAFAAIDPDGTVLNAKLLKSSRIVTLPKIQPLDCLVSQNLMMIEPEDLNLDKRIASAIRNMSSNFTKRMMKSRKSVA